ncbi:tyrosine-type recombinase/integrase [bacterium]|nr:tyrosine-type recombinase/integrase [bacterium]
MGVYRDKSSGNYGIRFQYYSREFKKIIGPDKRAAEIALQEVKNDIRIKKLAGQKWEGFQKLQRDTTPRTFADAAKDYMEERATNKPSTMVGYRSILNRHLLPVFGKIPLSAITSSQLKKFQAKLSDGRSERRVNGIMQLLRSILDQEYKEGRIDRDPSISVKRQEEPKADIDPLSEEELDLVLGNIDKHYRPLFTTLAFTGARPNEIIALRWSDIDWQGKSISITKGRVRGNEGKPKTRSSVRVIPFPARVEEALKEVKASGIASLDDYIFLSKKGKPIDKHLDRIWARALKQSGLRHRPSYQLRHTFATQCIIKGFPLPFIAKVLGHSTIDTLIRHYAGWIDSATKQYEDQLRNAFANQSVLNENSQEQKSYRKPEGRHSQALLRMAQS